MDSSHPDTLERISVVIPVYQGEKTLPTVVQELQRFTEEKTTPAGHRYKVIEVILVHDCGPDDSGATIARLAKAHPFVRPVWLSRNYGQHPATLAGMASSTGDWVVTMDEDSQQNPADIARMLDTAFTDGAQLVYAKPTNPPPHGMLRNFLSRTAKRVATMLIGNKNITKFNSFRLVTGEIARSLAAYCGNGVFLDVALFWITERITVCPVMLRKEQKRVSGYTFKRLLRHFWQLLLTSGTRPLRFITVMGFGSLILAVLITAYAVYVKFWLQVQVQGWSSIVIVVAFFSGCILMSLGIIAEYMAVTMSIAMGRPLYVVATRPTPPRQQ